VASRLDVFERSTDSHQRHSTASQGEARQFGPLFRLSSVPFSRAGAIQTAIQSP